MPPSLVEMPSPAMSVLKQYLCVNGYDVKIEYWNFKLNKLENDFVWNCEKRDRQEMLSMLLYCNYLSLVIVLLYFLQKFSANQGNTQVLHLC